MVKNLPAKQETQVRFLDGEYPPEKGMATYLLQYPRLENPMDRGAWWATVHKVAKSQTWLQLTLTYGGFSHEVGIWSIRFYLPTNTPTSYIHMRGVLSKVSKFRSSRFSLLRFVYHSSLKSFNFSHWKSKSQIGKWWDHVIHSQLSHVSA